MTLRQLEIFARVGSRLNLTETAHELHMHQPEISHQLKKLEQQVGNKLYRASRRGIELTPAGVAFLAQSQQILSQIQNLKVAMRSKYAKSDATILRIGGTSAPSTSYLPMLLARFEKTHSDIQINLRTAGSWELAEMILSGELDLALTRNRVKYRGIITEPFGQAPIVACVSPKHPLAKVGRLTDDALRTYRFVTRRAAIGAPELSYLSIERLKRLGLTTPSTLMECDSAEAKVAAIKNHLGIGLMHRSYIESDLKNGELVEIAMPGGHMYWRTYIIYRKTEPLSAPARDFLKLLREYRTTYEKDESTKRE
jgi:DNA-binding transcriptional LysR family regulator